MQRQTVDTNSDMFILIDRHANIGNNMQPNLFRPQMGNPYKILTSDKDA